MISCEYVIQNFSQVAFETFEGTGLWNFNSDMYETEWKLLRTAEFSFCFLSIYLPILLCVLRSGEIKLKEFQDAQLPMWWIPWFWGDVDSDIEAKRIHCIID